MSVQRDAVLRDAARQAEKNRQQRLHSDAIEKAETDLQPPNKQKHVKLLSAIEETKTITERLEELLNKINGIVEEEKKLPRDNDADVSLNFLLNEGSDVLMNEITNIEELIIEIDRALF